MDCDFRMRDVKMFTHFIYILSVFSIELFELTLFSSFFLSLVAVRVMCKVTENWC